MEVSKGDPHVDQKPDQKGSPRKRSVQSAHFKAFRVDQRSSQAVLQTVLPKRILKKAVDRNGLRRIIRESARACEISGIRVVLLQGRGFKECPSRKALKTSWREELDGLLAKLK